MVQLHAITLTPSRRREDELVEAAPWKMATQPDVKAPPDLASGEQAGRPAPPPDRHHHCHHLWIETEREMREREVAHPERGKSRPAVDLLAVDLPWPPAGR
jgi:hypothetical protein